MDKKRLIIVLMFVAIFIIAIVLSCFYYTDKYSICFETGTTEDILTQYVNENDKVKEPIEPTKEGYIFKEWQLNGETFDFDTEIKKDIVLTAKWIKEEYITITFNTDSDYIIESKTILKGDSIEELPESFKDEYEFIGWYYNDILYDSNPIYNDIVLTAKYNKIINFKIGDKVKIIGNYSNSSKATYAYNKRAIGWERVILNIIEGSEYPYVVGNKNGVTGFFKENSIEKI